MISCSRLPLRPSLTGIITLVLLGYVILIFLYIAQYDKNLSSLIHISADNEFYSKQKIDAGYVVYDHAGYDGQYNYYIVKDFFLKGNFPNSFRYQRILYPLLVYLLSLGKSNLYPRIFVLINLLSIALGMIVLMKLMGESSSCNLFLMALYGLNIGFLVAVFYDLGTPLAVFFILVAVYCYLKNKIGYCTVFFALSLLTLENAWLVITPLVLWTLWKKEYDKTKILVLCIVPWIGWQLLLNWKFKSMPIYSSAGFLTFPFAGIVDYFRMKPWQATSVYDALRHLDILPFLCFILVTLVVSGFLLFREKNLFSGLVFFHCLFAIFLSNQHIWSQGITSPSRALCGLFPFLILLFGQSEYKRILSFMIAWAWVLTILGILRLLVLPTHTYFIVPK